ncbi:MAG: hypothetical protein KF739_07520 [Cryobacterium sp.]|nr:hypothetical protein [Cryobacterium sp.]
MSRRSRTTLPGLLARQFRADLGPLLAMAAIVLVVATLASTAPLALRSMTSAEVAYQMDNLPASRRDLLSTAPGSPVITPGKAPFEQFENSLKQFTDSAPRPLRKALGVASFVTSTDALPVLRLGVEFNDPLTPITLNVSPALEKHVRLTAGVFPAPFQQILAPNDGDRFPISPLFDRNPVDPTIDILLSTLSAKEAKWAVGEERIVMVDNKHGFYAKLSGTFDAIDPKDGFWAAARYALVPGISYTSFSGSHTRIVTGAAFIDPGSWPVVLDQTSLDATTFVGFPFSSSGLTVEEDEDLLPQLRNFISQPKVLPKVAGSTTVASLTFNSDADATLNTALTRASTATSVLVMVASGPIGVAIAVLWLLSRLIILRRRDALALASARGASGTQVQLSQALEVFALSAPAAGIGAVLASALFLRSWSPIAVVIAIIIAIILPFLLPSPVRARPASDSRRPQSAHSPTTAGARDHRAALTAPPSLFLLQRGLTSNTDTVTVDSTSAVPSFSHCPLTHCACIYPPPPSGSHARRSGGRASSASFDESEHRDPAAGLAPVLAMVVGLAVAVFSGVLLGTVGSRRQLGRTPRVSEQTCGSTRSISRPTSVTRRRRRRGSGVRRSVPGQPSAKPFPFRTTCRPPPMSRCRSSWPIQLPRSCVQNGAMSLGLQNSTLTWRPLPASVPVLLSPDLAAQY